MAVTKYAPLLAINSGQALDPSQIPDEDKVIICPVYYFDSMSDTTPKTIASGIHQVGFITL